MRGEILSYLEMCQQEGVNLQKGMNYRLKPNYSVILMSQRVGAPYQDSVSTDGETLIYEGHDTPKTRGIIDPKSHDQPGFTPRGSLTENGKFHNAAQEFKQGLRVAEKVKVYEKIKNGIWADNGYFELVDSWQEVSGERLVYKFQLHLLNESDESVTTEPKVPENTRFIPSEIKIAVWKRDNGKCVECGATDHLHFDHIIPYSKGGSSLLAENIQLLCARHNLAKRDRIE